MPQSRLEGARVARRRTPPAARRAARSPRRPPPRTAAAGTPSRPASAIAAGARPARARARARAATPDAAARCPASPPRPSLRSSIARAPCAASQRPAAIRGTGCANARRASSAGAVAAPPGLERRARAAERAGDPEPVARARARARHRRAAPSPSTVTARLQTGPADRSPPTTARADRRGRVADAGHQRDAASSSRRRRRHGERRRARRRLRALGREIRERGRGGAPADLLEADPVEPEVHAFDAHVGARPPARHRPRRSTRAVVAQPGARGRRAPRRSAGCDRTPGPGRARAPGRCADGSRADGVEPEADQTARRWRPRDSRASTARSLLAPGRSPSRSGRTAACSSRANADAAVAGDPEARAVGREATKPAEEAARGWGRAVHAWVRGSRQSSWSRVSATSVSPSVASATTGACRLARRQAAGRTRSSCPGSASSRPRGVPTQTESPAGKTAYAASAKRGATRSTRSESSTRASPRAVPTVIRPCRDSDRVHPAVGQSAAARRADRSVPSAGLDPREAEVGRGPERRCPAPPARAPG